MESGAPIPAVEENIAFGVTDMLKDIVAVQPLKEHKLHLRFEDGVEGIVDVRQLVPFTGVFESLEDETYFAQAQADPELGTVCWPNGADLDPDVLYSVVTGIPLPQFEV
ncbi:MAG: DUF2442 domain-containing protein [Ardenticatenaceae bacterium]